VTFTTVFRANGVTQLPVCETPLSVHVNPVGTLLSVPPPSEPEAAERESVGGAWNCAVTLVVVPVASVAVQLVPVHAPE
jgi:hypothetical protein